MSESSVAEINIAAHFLFNNTVPILLYEKNVPKAINMAQSFRQLLGVPPSTASPSDSTLIIIDAQNEYAEVSKREELYYYKECWLRIVYISGQVEGLKPNRISKGNSWIIGEVSCGQGKDRACEAHCSRWR